MTPPTQHPLYPIFEVEYDDQHRAHILSDNDAEVSLPPLRPRTHTRAHQWDERYAPYIRRVSFLELVRVVNHGLSPLDTTLLTTAVDRWRPKTHTFHLPCGEMTLTLQDVNAILGLRLRGLPVTGIVDNDHWRELVAQFTGFLPPNDDASKKNKKSSGVSLSWITERFDYLDPQAEETLIDRFARMWL
ncbi:serine/threonine-protein phosphatase 7 long form homolog [Miscanthus floridulus]|uniref:serine/threonine-protein phosphatase 7 long form homolog n=1 Tax=Miscanthus floridulus TaxID=154761 RepID=UPI00345B323A